MPTPSPAPRRACAAALVEIPKAEFHRDDPAGAPGPRPSRGQGRLIMDPRGRLEVELVPVSSRPSFYAAVLGGRVLCRSRSPLFDAARVLLAEGVVPETELTARHAGSGTVALRSTVGEAARWAMEETDRDGLRRVRFNPARHARGRSGYASPGDDAELASTSGGGDPLSVSGGAYSDRPWASTVAGAPAWPG